MLPLNCCSRRSPESCDLCVLLTKHAVEKDASDEDIIFRGHFVERTRASGAENRKIAVQRMQPIFESEFVAKSNLYRKAVQHCEVRRAVLWQSYFLLRNGGFIPCCRRAIHSHGVLFETSMPKGFVCRDFAASGPSRLTRIE